MPPSKRTGRPRPTSPRGGGGRAARWNGLRSSRRSPGVRGPDWRAWPRALQAADSPQVRRFRVGECTVGALPRLAAVARRTAARRGPGRGQGGRHGLRPLPRPGGRRASRRRRHLGGSGLLRPGRIARRTARRLQPRGPDLEPGAVQSHRGSAPRPTGPSSGCCVPPWPMPGSSGSIMSWASIAASGSRSPARPEAT